MSYQSTYATACSETGRNWSPSSSPNQSWLRPGLRAANPGRESGTKIRLCACRLKLGGVVELGARLPTRADAPRLPWEAIRRSGARGRGRHPGSLARVSGGRVFSGLSYDGPWGLGFGV